VSEGEERMKGGGRLLFCDPALSLDDALLLIFSIGRVFGSQFDDLISTREHCL
jgi:hypothetical protein